MNPTSKVNAYRFGAMAEQLSCWALRLYGYRILQRHFRAVGGEIDIIARRGGIVAFVEVKARKNLDDALHALSPAQRRRIERTASAFLAQHGELSGLDARFDLIVLSPRRWPRHLVGAWIADA